MLSMILHRKLVCRKDIFPSFSLSLDQYPVMSFPLVAYDSTDSLSSSSSTSTITRPLQINHSIENTGPYPDTPD